MTTTAYGEYSSQYGFAGVSYASRTFTQGKNADFYGNVSAAATKTTADNESRVIGLNTIPYSNMMSYGMKAKSGKTTGSDSSVAELDEVNEEAGKETTAADSTADYLQFIRDKINEMYDKVENNEAEESFQIGASSFTEKEWSKLLEEFDDIQETIRELMREEHTKRQAKQEEREELADALVSESVISKYDSEDGEADGTTYIMWYNEDGMFCRKAGVTDGYEWIISFDSLKQYQMVDDFMKQFDKDDNLKFASNQKFWQDFLGGTIDANELGMQTGHKIALDPNALLSGSNSYQTTVNYLEIIQKLMGDMKLTGDMEHYLNYKKWFDELTK